jgi:hypothetical protein
MHSSRILTALALCLALAIATPAPAQRTTIDYRGMSVRDPAPYGAAGLAWQDNFKELADRIGPSNYTATTDPAVTDDVDEGYYIGSLWLNTATPSVWWCASNADGAAVWVDLTGGGTGGDHAAVTLSADLSTNLLGLSTQQLTLDSQAANVIFAGPATGAAAAPNFRALVAGDIPSLSSVYQPYDADLTSWAAFAPSAVAITGGTINGATIGATTPGSGKFSTLETSGKVGVRAAPSTYGLYVPWLAGDAAAAIYAGSDNASNNRYGVHGQSTSNWGICGQSTSSVGCAGTSETGFGIYGQSAHSYAAEFYRNTATPSGVVPVVFVHQDHASDPNSALRIRQDGTGPILELLAGASTRLTVANTGELAIISDTAGLKLGAGGGTTLIANGTNLTITDPTTGAKTLAQLAADNDTLGGIGSVANGDVLIYNNAWIRLPKGTENQVLKMGAALPAWGTDATGAGGSAMVLDLGDDGGNDSTDVTEFATSGDTNGIFSEPAADKILVNLGNDWPKADVADTANAGDSATSFFSSGTLETARLDTGIANTKVLVVDDATAADDDFARFTATGIEGLSVADTLTALNVESGADVTDATNVDAAGAVMNADYDAQTVLAATADNTPAAVTIAEASVLARRTGGNVASVSFADLKTDLALANVANVNTATGSTIGITIDGAGSAISTGVKGYIRIPYACTIVGVYLLADQAGSCVVDVWLDDFASYPPTDADTITAAAPPTLSTAASGSDTTLSGWTTAVSAGDVIAFNVDSASTITRLTLELQVTRITP